VLAAAAAADGRFNSATNTAPTPRRKRTRTLAARVTTGIPNWRASPATQNAIMSPASCQCTFRSGCVIWWPKKYTATEFSFVSC